MRHFYYRHVDKTINENSSTLLRAEIDFCITFCDRILRFKYAPLHTNLNYLDIMYWTVN